MEWLAKSALLGQAQLILTELAHVCDQLWVRWATLPYCLVSLMCLGGPAGC